MSLATPPGRTTLWDAERSGPGCSVSLGLPLLATSRGRRDACRCPSSKFLRQRAGQMEGGTGSKCTEDRSGKANSDGVGRGTYDGDIFYRATILCRVGRSFRSYRGTKRWGNRANGPFVPHAVRWHLNVDGGRSPRSNRVHVGLACYANAAKIIKLTHYPAVTQGSPWRRQIRKGPRGTLRRGP